MRFIKCVIFLLLMQATCTAAVIGGIDLFGSDELTAEQLIAAEPLLFASFCEELKVKKGAESIGLQLAGVLQKKFSLAYIKPTAVTYYEPQGKVTYITFDVVEEGDRERLKFLDFPQGAYEDPEGLLAAWDRYMSTAIELLDAGEIDAQMVPCAAYHYVFGHRHPKLAPFESLFIEGAQRHKSRLIEIFLNDHNPQHRATAPLLLAYLPEGQELVDLLSKRIKDPSFEVRNNILRIFTCIATDHPEICLPIEEIIQALNFPETLDRNKAAAIIYSLDSIPQNLLASAYPILLKMLKLKQPNNSIWAYEILKKLSHQDYPKEDIVAWEKWTKEINY